MLKRVLKIGMLASFMMCTFGAFAQEEPEPYLIPVLNDNAEIVVNPNTNYSYTLKFTVIDGTNNCSVKCSQYPDEQINLEIPSIFGFGSNNENNNIKSDIANNITPTKVLVLKFLSSSFFLNNVVASPTINEIITA